MSTNGVGSSGSQSNVRLSPGAGNVKQMAKLFERRALAKEGSDEQIHVDNKMKRIYGRRDAQSVERAVKGQVRGVKGRVTLPTLPRNMQKVSQEKYAAIVGKLVLHPKAKKLEEKNLQYLVGQHKELDANYDQLVKTRQDKSIAEAKAKDIKGTITGKANIVKQKERELKTAVDLGKSTPRMINKHKTALAKAKEDYATAKQSYQEHIATTRQKGVEIVAIEKEIVFNRSEIARIVGEAPKEREQLFLPKLVK